MIFGTLFLLTFPCLCGHYLYARKRIKSLEDRLEFRTFKSLNTEHFTTTTDRQDLQPKVPFPSRIRPEVLNDGKIVVRGSDQVLRLKNGGSKLPMSIPGQVNKYQNDLLRG